MTADTRPRPRPRSQPRPDAPQRPASSRATTAGYALAVAGLGLLVAGFAVAAPDRFGLLLPVAAVAAVLALWGLSSPVVAAVYLLAATFFRLAVPDGLVPVEPFMLAFAGLLLSVLLWTIRHRAGLPRLGLLGVAVVLYAAANVISLVSPHQFEATYPIDGTEVYVGRLVLIGVVMPLVVLVLGMTAFAHERALRALLFTVMGFAGYSAAVSILQFTVPALVWPRYIVDSPGWDNRAVGVFNQPVVNGLVLVLGYLAALLVASRPGERRVVRVAAGLLAPACVVGVYLTYTRAAWLSFAFVVVLGLVLASGWRRGFALTLLAMVAGVAADWSSFTSTDRSEGGVGSAGEVQDRMNMIATSWWALQREPLFGWGVGRFPSINTYYHQQWSPTIPWERGYGFASHFDALGVTVELGIVGLALWLLTMGSILVMLVRSVRRLPGGGLYDRPVALFALLALLTWFLNGLTVDLRFFDFPNLLVMLLVGAVIGRAMGRGDARGST